MLKHSIHSKSFLFSMLILLFINGCGPRSTPASVEPLPVNTPTQSATLQANAPPQGSDHLTVAEVEKLAGFDVKEPSYLPSGVSFDFATYQKTPDPNVILHYKYVHETYGDMGAFFQIVQEPETSSTPNACGTSGDDCELVQVGNVQVKYRFTSPTESLTWETDRFSFELLRTAGEPDKVYKDELLKVVGSMQ